MKKKNAALSIASLANGRNRSDGGNADARSGADAERTDDSSSVNATSAGNVSDSGTNDASNDDGSELPIGDGGAAKRARKRANLDSLASLGGDIEIGGASDERSSRDRDASDSDNADRTETRTSSSRRVLPREITLDSLGTGNKKSEKKDTKLSIEFLSEGFGLLFAGLAVVFNDEEWKLSEEDASELGDRTGRWLKHGAKNVAAFEKKLAKYEPAIMLLLGFIAVLIPRIINTRNKRRAIRIQEKAKADERSHTGNGNGNGVAPVQDIRGGDVVENGTLGDVRPVPAGYSPIRRKAWTEVPGTND